MEIPASEFYKDYDKEDDKETMAVITVFPMKGTSDIMAASNIDPKPKGPVKKDNWNYQIRSSGKLRERPKVKLKNKECLATWIKLKCGRYGTQEVLPPALLPHMPNWQK